MKLTLKVPTLRFEMTVEGDNSELVIDTVLFGLMLLKEKLRVSHGQP
ncbi:hypothetical protein ES702_02211 [subsurface metagenome]